MSSRSLYDKFSPPSRERSSTSRRNRAWRAGVSCFTCVSYLFVLDRVDARAAFATLGIMHHCLVFAHHEGVPVGDGEVVGALHPFGEGERGDDEVRARAGVDAVAGLQVRRLYPALAFDLPGMVVGGVERLRLAARIQRPQRVKRLRLGPDQIRYPLRRDLGGGLPWPTRDGS